MLEKLLRKGAMALGPKVLVALVRGVAEGKYGPRWQAAYVALAGVKRLTALALGAAAAIAFTLGEVQAAAWVASAAGLLCVVGLLDANWRAESPAVVFRGNRFYRLLADNSATVTVALATAAAYIEAGQCGGYDCALLMRGLLVLAALLVYLGCADAAWKATPPLIKPSKR